jgi:RHS repeat-associated protein
MKKQFLIIQFIVSLGLVDATAQTVTAGKNAIMEQTPREAMTTLTSSTYKTVQSSIGYFDGLGRPNMTVVYRGSADASKDLITSTALYDIFGRNYKNILPVASNNSTGDFSTQSEALAKTFYNDQNPFTEVTLYENSPMNRPLNSYGVGENWRTNTKFVESKYLIANSGVVLLFNVTSTGATLAGTYGANQLTKNVLVSEQGNEVVEYKDKDGKIIQRDVQDGEGTYLSVLFIYDDFDRLRYVIQPKALIKFGNTPLLQSFSEGDAIFKEGIFGYVYDSQSRIIEKKNPGAGTHFYVYDKNDRIVLHADEADKANDYWQFNKYDIFGRILYQGLIRNIGSFSRSQLQADFDTYGLTNQTYETRGNTLLGYTNVSFPSSYTPAEPNVKLVTYYDDYDFNTDVNYNFKSSEAFHSQQTNVKGMLTGKLVRNLKTNTWQKMVLYYDYQGRIIEDFHLTNKGNLVRKDNQYRFNGELLKSRYVKTNSANVVLSTKILSYEYDHLSRKIKFKYSLNGVEKTIATYSYDDIGRMKTKLFSPSTAIGSNQSGLWTNTGTWQGSSIPTISDNVTINAGHTVTIPNGQTVSAGSVFDKGILQNFGILQLGNLPPSTSTGTLQILDYKYHIRGWLKSINSDASGNLTDNLFSYRLDYENGANGLFDGNISKQYWKSNIDGKERSFEFLYDPASRLKSGTYVSTQAGENYSLNNMDYDKSGNITALSRNGATNTNYTAFGNVDNLTYTYQGNSNKLSKIQDGTTGNADLGDFRDGVNTDDDYDFFLDGSLKKDKNKKIASITYNYLKLPETIIFDNGRTITTEYDAEGTKLKKIVSGGETTDYEEDDIYVNNVLYQTSHDEGRINAQGEYEYNITDHNNDLRVAFRDSSGIAVPTQSIFYDAWGLSMKGMQITRNPLNFNHYQFLSRELQIETGLVDLTHRQYDPQTGRFLSQDPVTDGQEHLSLYQYGWNNPILKPDPNGLMPSSDDPPTKTSLAIHTGLDAVGLIPGFGELADGANAIYYLAEGNKTDAGLSVASMIPIAGWFATGAKTIRNVDKAVDVAKAGERAIDIAKGGDKVKDVVKASTKGADKGSLSGTKEALAKAKAEIGLKPTESLSKGKQGKFGGLQKGDSKKGYRLDPSHPNAKAGSGEEYPHVNFWDYTKGKRDKGGISGAIPITF